MSDTEQDELFGSDTEEFEIEPPPEYVNTPEFKAFVKAENLKVHEKYGFVQLKTFKPYYFSG